MAATSPLLAALHIVAVIEAVATMYLIMANGWLRAGLRGDKAKHIDGIAAQLQDDWDEKRYPSVYKQLQRLKPPGKRKVASSFGQPLPAVREADGTLANTRGAIAKRWQQHFGDQEAADIISLGELVSRFTSRRPVPSCSA